MKIWSLSWRKCGWKHYIVRELGVCLGPFGLDHHGRLLQGVVPSSPTEPHDSCKRWTQINHQYQYDSSLFHGGIRPPPQIMYLHLAFSCSSFLFVSSPELHFYWHNDFIIIFLSSAFICTRLAIVFKCNCSVELLIQFNYMFWTL